MRRRELRAVLLTGALAATQVVPVAEASAAGASCAAPSWAGTWSASMQATSQVASAASQPTNFTDQTFRMIVVPHIGGSAVRVRLSNRFGDDPLVFDDVHVGVRMKDAIVAPGTNRPLTFGGKDSVTIVKGGEVVSDAIPFEVRPFAELAVSFHVQGGPHTVDWHRLGLGTSYLTPQGAGPHGGDEDGAAFTQTTTSKYVVSAVDVLAPRRVGVVVALGDSITDGTASTPDANQRWPDELARRILATQPPERQFSVLNAGVGGNQVTNDNPVFGLRAMARLEPDVLAQTGVTDVIVHEGTNDIGLSGSSAERITAGLRSIADRARARGINVIGTTLTPTEGSATHGGPQAMPTHDAVNEWIRTGGAFDAVFDFEAATADPARPKALRPEYDSGDGLHPSDAGYDAMAAAVDLSKLRGPDCAGGVAMASAAAAGPPNPVEQVPVTVSARYIGSRVRGRVVLPPGLPATACRYGSVGLLVGRASYRVRLRADCSFSAKVRRARRVVVRFSGTETLRAVKRTVRRAG